MHILYYLILFTQIALGQIPAAETEEALPPEGGTPSKPQFVWVDSEADKRLQVAYFRYGLTLESLPEEAEISLFASSRYHLFVNGKLMNSGPARAYPENPEYDQYNLLSSLEIGENVILVKVVSDGTGTFLLGRSPAAFIAWGELKLPDESDHSLNTPGDWLCRIDQGYDTSVPRVSFVLGPMEVYDARLEIQDWHSIDPELSRWSSPTPLLDQDAWGPFHPRSIPRLTREIVQPQALLGAYRLSTIEDIYSFRVKSADSGQEEVETKGPLFGYTFIHSPTDQQVQMGISPGSHFLNGSGPVPHSDPTGNPHRQETLLSLKTGWNPFFVKGNSIRGLWDFYLAVAKEADLSFSPTRTMNDTQFFMTAGPFPEDEELAMDALPIPFDLDGLPPELEGRWQAQKRATIGVNPAIDLAWRVPGMPLRIPSDQVDTVELKIQGDHALIYDFRYKRLGRIAFTLDAPQDTVVDIGFSEDLLAGRPWMMKQAGLYTASRLISAGDPIHFETSAPYGLRYLQLNVLDASGPVTIENLHLIEQVYPFDQIGEFECEDPLLNAIWELGWRTLRVCAEDSYTNTPFGERALDAGSILPQMAITLSGSRDVRLVKRSLQLFQDMYAAVFDPQEPEGPGEPDRLEDYPLLTLEALGWYLDRTGDLEFAREVYPSYHRLLSRLASARDSRGLVQTRRVFIEQTGIEKKDLASTAFNAILARSFSTLARIALELEYNEDAETLEGYANQLKQAIRENLWDSTRGAFIDGIKDGSPVPSAHPISNALPVLFGLADHALEAPIANFLQSELTEAGETRTTPYGSFYILGALYRLGLSGLAEEFIRERWGPMIMRHNDTAWEDFGDRGDGTLSHAWSGSPTFFLTTEVLGVDLGFPGPSNPDRIVISPNSESLTWAKGTVPHSKGRVTVSWKVVDDRLEVTCSVPDGVDWSVRPRGRLSKYPLFINGEPADSSLKGPEPSS